MHSVTEKGKDYIHQNIMDTLALPKENITAPPDYSWSVRAVDASGA